MFCNHKGNVRIVSHRSVTYHSNPAKQHKIILRTINKNQTSNNAEIFMPAILRTAISGLTFELLALALS